MASTPIEQIKQKIDIVSEIGAVVALQRSGKAYKGRCPFHDERTPSFYVFPETGTWRCFGCNEGGDIFSFFSKQFSLDFPQTLTLLAEKAGVSLGFTPDDPFESHEQSGLRKRLREMNEVAAVWFHYQLLSTGGATYARSYIQSRGISNESIAQFRLGFAPDGDGLTRHLLAQGYGEQEIIDAGFARRRDADKGGTLYDYFRNRLIFPIRDTRAQVIAFGGRELGGGQPKYLNSPQTPLFDKSGTLYAFDLAREAARKQDGIVVVEGYVDAVIAHQYGYRNTVACIGSAITARHVQQIKRITQRLILALDPDAAGEHATLRAIEVAQEGFDRVLVPIPLPAPDASRALPRPEGQGGRKRRAPQDPQGMIRFEEQVEADIRIVQLPDGIDPDEFIRADPAAWQHALDIARPLMDFYFATMLQDLDLRSPQGQTEASRRLLPLIASVGDRIKRESYVIQLAKLLRIDERDVQHELQRYRKQRQVSGSPESDAGTRSDGAKIANKSHAEAGQNEQNGHASSYLADRMSAIQKVEELCIGLLLNYPEIRPEVCAILEVNDFWGTETRALFGTLASPSDPPPGSDLATVLAPLPALVRSEAERLRAQASALPQLDRTQLARTAKQVASRLKRSRLTEAITELSYLQREADSQNDRETSRLLRAQTMRLIQARQTLDAADILQT